MNLYARLQPKQRLVALLVLFCCFYNAHAQINVNTSATLTQIINSLVGPGNTVSNVTMNCPGGAYGTFTNGNSTNVGMNSGVLLTTGSASAVNGTGGSFASVDNGAGGDPLLNGLAGATTYDACSIEFDITPACGTLQMQYVFGSEEYPEFVNLGYNDAFGFFITGPNPSGPAYNNQNIAIIPSTTTPVTIDNVNSGSYSQYYVDNQSGTSIAYDGLTTPLTATINVVPCASYHMVIVIADGGDGIYDSGVFLTYQGLQCPSPVVTASSNTTICSGSSTTLTANFPAPSPTYTWSPATGLNTTTGSSVIASPVTTTTYVVTAVSGCNTSTDTVIVTVIPQPTVTVTPSSSTICPSTSVTLTASGATSYAWSPTTNLSPTTGSTVTASPSSTTVYTVTGSNGSCTATASATVTVVNNLTVTITPPTSSICSGGTVALTASGATTYTWSPGTGLSATTGANVNASPTTTTVYTVTGASGSCTATATATITVTPQPTVTVTPASATICPNGSVVLTASGATGYTWSPTTNLSPTTGSTVTASPSSTTVYTVTGSNGNCTATASATVTVSNALVVDAGPNDSICQGSSTTLTVTGAPAGSSITWSPTAGLGNPTSVSTTASPLTTTTYTVTVTDPGGCTGSDVVTITVVPNPTLATAGFSPTCSNSCNGQVVVIPNNGTQPYTILWSTGCSTASCNNLCPGTYSVTVTDALGCTVSGNATVNPTPPITLTSNETPSTCGQPDGSICVQAAGGNPGYTYSWNTTPAQNTACATGLVPGIYCVTVTDLNGCTANICDTVTITPGISASACNVVMPTCNGACNGSADVCVNGGNAPYTYSWSNAQTTQVATGLCAGTYTVTVTAANGCSDTAVVTIIDPPIVTVAASASPTTICIGQSSSLTAAGAGGTGSGYTYDWDNGTFSGSPYSVSPSVTTVYSVIASDGNGCPSAPATVTVTVNPPLSVTAAGATTVCPGGNATLTANGNGGGGTYTYTWLPSPTPPGSPVNVTVNTTTTFTVIITDGCTLLSDSDTVTVFVSPLPTVNFSTSNPSGCAPVCTDFVDLSTPGSGTLSSWSWDFGDNSTGSAQNPSNHCYTTVGSYSVTLTVTNSFGCQSTLTIPNMINVYGYPTANFSFGPQPTTVLDPQICFTDQSIGAVSWTWDFDDPSDPAQSNSQNPCFIYSDTGTYCPMLTVTNAQGCPNDTTFCLVISPDFTFYIPNAFTPNGDGINDEFSGSGMFITEYEMWIFDRWGNLIYYTDDMAHKWDGHANHGKYMAQEDVYVYVVKLTDIFEKEHKYIGHVTLIK